MSWLTNHPTRAVARDRWREKTYRQFLGPAAVTATKPFPEYQAYARRLPDEKPKLMKVWVDKVSGSMYAGIPDISDEHIRSLSATQAIIIDILRQTDDLIKIKVESDDVSYWMRSRAADSVRYATWEITLRKAVYEIDPGLVISANPLYVANL